MNRFENRRDAMYAERPSVINFETSAFVKVTAFMTVAKRDPFRQASCPRSNILRQSDDEVTASIHS